MCKMFMKLQNRRYFSGVIISADVRSWYVVDKKFQNVVLEYSHDLIDCEHLWKSRNLEPNLNENFPEDLSVTIAQEFLENSEADLMKKLLFVTLTLMLLTQFRFRVYFIYPHRKTWLVVAFMLFPGICHSQETTNNNEKDSYSIVWALVGLLAIVLIVCYRFQIFRMCYNAAQKYLAVPSFEQPAVVMEFPSVNSVEQTDSRLYENCVVEKVYPDIDIGDFISHVKQLKKDGDIGFAQEFCEITQLSQTNKYPCEHFNRAENIKKNRYINIATYDHSRVILKTEKESDVEADYINANYIHGYKKPNAYIATQGPLPHTVSDFWRMVWEQNTNVIVMITNLMEKGRNKCEQYWPTDGEETYEDWTVRLMSTDSHAYYTIRVLSLLNVRPTYSSEQSREDRTVYHYHYTEWPDHGVPDFSLPVLSFVKKSAAQSGPDNGPIIVHCSAGVGRSGTYIMIESMIAQVNNGRSVNIPAFILEIRRQRNFLVQTEEQYKFIHEVIVEYLMGNGSTEIREEGLSDYLLQLDLPYWSLILGGITNLSLLETQFQNITEYAPTTFDLSVAIEPVNQPKNRKGGLLPVLLSRVVLPARPGVPGSDYINASFLQGNRKSSEFIVTQAPMRNTTEDFWRMAWYNRSPVIVVLTTQADEENNIWIPNSNHRVMDLEELHVSISSELIPGHTKDFTTLGISLDFKELQPRNDNSTWQTKVIIVKDWLYHHNKLHQMFNPIFVAQSYLKSSECGPVIVMDRFGGFEAGRFCALWTLGKQLLSEKCADFYQVCKLYHYKRPGIIGSKENYLLLHQAMASLYKHLTSESYMESTT